nr:CopD family protein [Micromonospora sp. DSM 115978]
AVAAIVASGVLQTWREVGVFGAFFDTDYGRLLLYKLWIFGVMLALGAMAQRWVVRHYRPVVQALAAVDTAASGPAEPPRSRPRATPSQVAALRRGVLFEVALGAAVLAVTAVLVNTIPARTSYSPPFAETVFA